MELQNGIENHLEFVGGFDKEKKHKFILLYINNMNYRKNLLKKSIHQINYSLNYPLKQNYNSIIPLNIYQTWHTKNLPINMFRSINQIKNNNPAFKYHLFDDNDCREFIKNNFPVAVLKAFDKLIPGAYKADLWRYCILYKKGGIYLDIKYTTVNNFKFINLSEKEHLVLDIDGNNIYNALMVCLPNNKLLYKAINQIVYNTNNNYYGKSSLDPTGPGLLSKLITADEINYMIDMKHKVLFNDLKYRIILFNNYLIIKNYNNYQKDFNEN